MYLISKGLVRTEGEFEGQKYNVEIDGLPEYRSWDPLKQKIILCLNSEKIETFNALANIVEEFLISGYDPGDVIMQELKTKYTPVRFVCEEEMAYHDESDEVITIFNSKDEVIAKVGKRNYSYESGIRPMLNYLIDKK